MRRYYIFSGILLILPIIEFAVAAPALVQEKRHAGVDVVHIPDPITMLGKRGNELDELWLKYLKDFENYFADNPSAARPSSSSPPGWTEVGQPLPSIPKEPSPMSSPDHAPPSPGSLSESGYESASSTLSDADHELMGAHTLPNPGPSTESDHDLTRVHAPLSSPVLPTWFQPAADHGLMGAHAPQPNLGPSNPGPLTGFDSNHRFVVEEPPSRPASPTEFDADHEHEVENPPPPPPGSASRRYSGASMRRGTS